jgi:hypothetical protein
MTLLLLNLSLFFLYVLLWFSLLFCSKKPSLVWCLTSLWYPFPTLSSALTLSHSASHLSHTRSMLFCSGCCSIGHTLPLQPKIKSHLTPPLPLSHPSNILSLRAFGHSAHLPQHSVWFPQPQNIWPYRALLTTTPGTQWICELHRGQNTFSSFSKKWKKSQKIPHFCHRGLLLTHQKIQSDFRYILDGSVTCLGSTRSLGFGLEC